MIEEGYWTSHIRVKMEGVGTNRMLFMSQLDTIDWIQTIIDCTPSILFLYWFLLLDRLNSVLMLVSISSLLVSVGFLTSHSPFLLYGSSNSFPSSSTTPSSSRSTPLVSFLSFPLRSLHSTSPFVRALNIDRTIQDQRKWKTKRVAVPIHIAHRVREISRRWLPSSNKGWRSC